MAESDVKRERFLCEAARLYDAFMDRAGPAPKKALETDPRRILANNVHYFRTNRDGMDYPQFRRRGWPVGSGVIESAVKLVGKRVKGLEKHWNVDGAEQTLQVVASLLSDDGSWEHACKPTPLLASA